MNFAALALKNKISTLVFVFLILVGGLLAYRGLSRLEDPEFTIKDALIITGYPGATAKEVEEEVTDVIETAVQQLGQIRHVTSTSTPGRSLVTVTIQDQFNKTSLPQVWDELRRKVNDAQRRLPPGAGPSLVRDDFGDVFGIFLALSGDGFSYAQLRDTAKLLQRELSLVRDVANVTLSGLQRETIYIEIPRARLASLGVPETKIYAALAGKNLMGPSGAVEVGRERIRIIPEPSLETVESIGDIVIEGLGSGRQLFVRDVATISRGYEDPPSSPIVRLDGEPAIGIGISIVSGGNVVVMGEAVKRRIAELKSRLPVGLELGTIYFQPDIVVRGINEFVIGLLQAVAIVVGVLLFAMGIRSGILIGAGLLLTILATFIAMSSTGVALERISLGALVIALSMMVDNAIVVVEGMLIGMERGGDPEQVAIETVGKTTWPLLGGTAVAVLAFAAIGLSQDKTGEYTFSLFLVILYSLGLSWLLAVTVTPLPRGHDPQGGAVGRRGQGSVRRPGVPELPRVPRRVPAAALGHPPAHGRAPGPLDLRVPLGPAELLSGLDHAAVHGGLLGAPRHGHPPDVGRPRTHRATDPEARRREVGSHYRRARRHALPSDLRPRGAQHRVRPDDRDRSIASSGWPS